VEFVLAEALGGEYRTHLAILDAVAGGATKLEQMASHAGVKATSLPPYIRDLTELLHVLTRFRWRRTYYEFRDRFYAFWLRAVYRHRDVTPEDALGDVAAAELEEFFRWAFEATVRELLPRLYPVKRATKETAFLRSGGRRVQLDVDAFGVNEQRKFAVLAEAKWGPADPHEILPKPRAAQVLTPSGWEVKYAIFAKSFTRETREADLITVEALMRLAAGL
jgi:hypothetical protein